jgi:hypothetical protein
MPAIGLQPHGRVRIENGFQKNASPLIAIAPLRPGEFVVRKIQHTTRNPQPEEDPAMASSNVKPERFDPYKNFKFRVKSDGQSVTGGNKAGAPKGTTEGVKPREGGGAASSRKSSDGRK